MIVAATIIATLISLIVSMISDMRKFIIPNKASIVISISFLIFSQLEMTLETMLYHLITGLVIFALCFFLYLKKLFGAGDVKLLAAVSLWAGPYLILPLLFIVSIIGGLTGLFFYSKAYLKTKHTQNKLNKKAVLKQKIPYGIAISIGGFFVLYPYILSVIS